MAEITSVSYGSRQHVFGLGSNFNTQAMVDYELQVLADRDIPFLSQLEYYQQEKNVWNDVLSRVTSLRNTTNKLNDIALENKQVTFSEEGFVKATATSSAADGTYNIEVVQTASKQKLLGVNKGNSQTALGYKTVTKINEKDFTVTEDMSLTNIKDSINSGGYGVRASIIENTLVLTAEQMGAGGEISITDNYSNGLIGAKMFEELGILTSTGAYANEIAEARDSIIKIDGVSVQRSTNELTDVVAGLSISITKETTDPIVLEVKKNDEALLTQAETFVSEYNKIITSLNQYTAKEAILQGRSSATSVRRDIGRFLSQETDSTLYAFQIGLTSNKAINDGTIVLDKIKLKEQLEKNPEEVMKLLNGENGLISKLHAKLTHITGETGTLKNQISGVDGTIKRLQERLDKNAESYERQKESIIARYSKLESMLSMSTAQGDYMAAQIAAWNQK